MRFIIAPDWFMKLNDDDTLVSKQVLHLYGYAWDHRSSNRLVEKGYLPAPNIRMKGKGNQTKFWSVGYLKNYLKLPTELRNVQNSASKQS